MSKHLCTVCGNLPEEFWSTTYDLFETRHEAKARLQSYHSMEQQKLKGCQLCAFFLESLTRQTTRDPKECLYLWRHRYEPHRAFCLGGAKFRESFGNFYFLRVPDPWCALPLARMGESIDNVHIMRSWLQNRKQINGTSPDQSRQFVPTRLLDVSAFQNSKDIRLVHFQGVHAPDTASYMALSHCWGGKVPVQLGRENIKRWLEGGIAFKSLPKTFRDAVTITRKLGCRYLWIDSMCIIQDSTSDWTQEASLMAEVYGNALCTLAALSSKNSSEGWHLDADVQKSLDCSYVELEVLCYGTSRIRLFDNKPRSWIDEFDGRSPQVSTGILNPLRTRAWVLQEKELSNCTIYFAKNQLLWENGPYRATAQVPWLELRPQTQAETPRLIHQTTSHKIVAAPQSSWYELVEDYTSRSLSFSADKLVAFSGLAKKFGSGNKQYCAGIWSSDLPAALLWRVKDGHATRPGYLAPSWSWASLMGSITYDSLVLEPDNDCAKFETPEDTYAGLRTLRVQRIDMTLAQSDKKYGDVHKGVITLSEARCIEVRCCFRAAPFSDGGQPLMRGKEPIGVFYPDILEEADRLKETYCVALQSESVWSIVRHEFRLKQDSRMISLIMGIVVARLPHSQEYRRIGLARWIDESLFDGVRAGTVKLV